MKQNEIRPEIATALENSGKIRDEAAVLLKLSSEELDLVDWLTIKEYAKKINVESPNVIHNWIRRGVIPVENVRTIRELNDIRLIKAIPYREQANSPM